MALQPAVIVTTSEIHITPQRSVRSAVTTVLSTVPADIRPCESALAPLARMTDWKIPNKGILSWRVAQ